MQTAQIDEEMLQMANQQFDMQIEDQQIEQSVKPVQEEVNEEERKRRQIIMDAQIKCKQLVYQIHSKEIEIDNIKREIDDQKRVCNYLAERPLVAYDNYLRATTREQDRRIYELELINAAQAEIEARIEKVNKEYKKNIYPLVVGEFKTQIETEIKGYKNQVEILRTQFKELTEEITKIQEKQEDNLDMYSTLQRHYQEQLLANEQLQQELDQIKQEKNSKI